MKQIVSVSLIVFFSFCCVYPVRGEEPPISAAIDSDGLQRAEIKGGGYFFKPNRIILKVNVPTELKLTKESGMVPHNFVIKAPEAGIDIDVPLGTEPKVITFKPIKTGTYAFHCSKKLLFFESHEEKGMKGIIEVVE